MAKASSRKTVAPKSKLPQRVAARSAISKNVSRRTEAKAKPAKRDIRVMGATNKLTSAGRAGSKQAQVLTMLRGSAGTTIKAIMSATGWQAHSVRGFFAGVVRTKLGLVLTSEVSESGRIYRVSSNGVQAASASTKASTAA